ncbi:MULTISPECIES: hypothetical protein, partial [Pseudanabaena]
PWSHTQLLQRQIVNIPNVADVPVEAAIDRSHWQKFHLIDTQYSSLFLDVWLYALVEVFSCIAFP